ncbi:MAG: deoxyribose-phosphate aldolase [Oscillospiraceae bacterium]|jgi:deoxyribose-phosphate aldolase|nr:deoxyribose-phosphate aldolase [Oscillospiraceae bacterium]
MKNSEILSHVDHTLLKAAASWAEIQELCREALLYKTASVCIPPSYIKRIAGSFPGLNICTVIGFPLGYSSTDAKVFEGMAALSGGAGELDMVINLGDVKNGKFKKIRKEIRALKEICGKKILKVIIETCYLTAEEKIALCGCVTESGADYIKTSTGFGTAGALIEDILLFKKHIGSSVKIKAAGGIRTKRDMIDFLEAGCSRLGTSSAVKILAGEESGDY